jgi:hypothetical protein
MIGKINEMDKPIDDITRKIGYLSKGTINGNERAWVTWDDVSALVTSWRTRSDALKALVASIDKMGVRALVAGWNGEGREVAPFKRHPARLGATLRTNCGNVYALDEATERARKLLNTNS